MLQAMFKIPVLTYSLFSLGLTLLLSFNWISVGSAQDSADQIRIVRAIETDELGINNPVGLAFSQNANAFHVLETHRPTLPQLGYTDIVLVTAVEDKRGSARIAASITDPINATFDDKYDRLLIFQPNSNKLILVDAAQDGSLDQSSLYRFDARHFDLQDPQGMAVDPESGQLFILNRAVPEIVSISPTTDGSFEGATISRVDLQLGSSTGLQGLAFEPTSGNLHVLNPAEQVLYEITTAGQIVGSRDLSAFNLDDPQAIVFAPSADLTDDPAQQNLYIADSGLVTQENLGASSAESSPELLAGNEAQQNPGNIAEFSFVEAVTAEAASFTSNLVQTIDTSAFNPPSPDTAGIAYIEWTDTYLFSDSEVNEMPIFTGDNLFEMTATGNLLNTTTTIPWSKEPTGVAYNPGNDHVFISQDDGKEVFELVAGADTKYGTSDDTITSFDTLIFNSGDPEGIAFDNHQGLLFIVDGVNSEVYRVDPGSNGLFDGIPPTGDDQVTSFDTLTQGIQDPEGITYNSDNDTLYVVGKPPTIVAEFTTAGVLVQTIDISAANARKPAGLAYGPGSSNPNVKNIFIAERGVDNGSDPNENDGKVYELTLPPVGPAPPTANDDSASTLIATPVTIDVAANDSDPNGNLVPASANTTCDNTCTEPSNGSLVNNGDGTFTYTPGPSFLGDDSFIYQICDTDLLCDTATVTISVGEATVEVRVSASSDDAEERVGGGISLTSSDIELVFDSGGDQVVGMRFNGTNMPPGANITSAYIQFQVDEINTGATSLIIQGEDVDNAATFTSSSWNITSRPRTAAAVSWSPPPWNTKGEAGVDQRTSDISSVIQEIVSHPGWTQSSSLVIIISGTGERTAEAYNGDQSGAPLLHIEYGLGGAPQVTINSPTNGTFFNEGYSINFTGTAVDNEEGDLTSSLSWESNIDGSIGTGGSFSRSDLSTGVHNITATVTDGDGFTSSDTVVITIFSNTPVLVGAGDIASCSYVEDEETAKLLDNIPGTVFTLGDNVYPDGTEIEFNDCYDPTWGRHKARTRPATGNHDYHTPGASAYFNYFGAPAGEVGKGYYSYDVGEWHIIALNSECSAVGGCDSASPQGQWLQADLAVNSDICTLAYWHEPLFSSGAAHGGNYATQDFWQLLYDAGADVVLNGHEHNYERFGLQDPSGIADPGRGIREFVVGTGGAGLYTFGIPEPNSEIRNSIAHGVLKLTLNSNSYDWEFIPIAGQTFTDSGSASCVSPSTNNPPLAVDDSASTPEDTPVTIDAAANDSDVDGNLDPTSASVTTAPLNGSVTNHGDGTFTYTPNADFNGSDSFDYEVCDSGIPSLCDTATVSITVSPIDDAPVANDDTGTVTQGGTLNQAAPGVLSNDSDPENDPLTLNTTPLSGPTNGILTLNTDGSYSYTHDGSETTTDSFVYEICDTGPLCDTATVVITVSLVNDPPVASDDTGTVAEGGTLNQAAPGVLSNDSDPDNGPLTLNTTPVSGPANGTLTLNADGSYTYTHDGSETAADNFVYQICDTGPLCDTATVVITITPVNDPPVATDDTGTVTQGGTLNEDAPGVLSNDSDPENDPLTLNTTPLSGPTNGILTLNADGSYSYIHDGNETTTDNFVYEICDTGLLCDIATVLITIQSSTPTAFEVRVTASSDDAEEKISSGRVGLTSSDLELVLEKEIQTVGIRFNRVTIPQGATITSAHIQFKADETHSDPTTLTIEGQADVNPLTFDNTIHNISSRPKTNAKVSWSPDPWTTRGEAGPAQQTSDIASIIQELVNQAGWLNGNSMVFIITGSGKRVAESYNGDQAGAPLLHVEYTSGPPNNPPVAVDDTGTVAEGGTLNQPAPGVLSNDSDPDNDPLALNTTPVSGPTNGSLTLNADGSYTYAHDGSETTIDSFVYQVCDTGPLCDTATVVITINPVNDPPVANASGPYTGVVGVLLQFDGSGSYDVDGTISTYAWEFGDGNSGTGINPTHTYTAVGGYTVVLTVTDDGGVSTIDTTTANISAEPNNPPVATDDTGTVAEGETLNQAAPGVLSNDSDPDNDPLTLNTTPVSGPTNGSLILSDDGSYSYTHDGSETITDSFVYEICDTEPLCDTATVVITITPANDPPVANDDTGTVAQGGTLNQAAPGVLSNDSDPENDPLTLNTTPLSGPANGILTLNADGSYSYTHDGSETTTDSFVYQVCDTAPLCDTATVTISVQSLVTPISVLYVSSTSGGSVGGVDFKDEDILAFDIDTGVWSMYFDGSDVGLDVTGQEVDALHINADGSILLSLGAAGTIPDVGSVDDFDILRFIPTSLGDITSGSYELYFDGEDVGLTGEDIDAIGFAPDGRLVISPRGSYNVGGISGQDEDLLIFTATSLGETTSGTWELYFDGSDVALDTASSEDVNGIWIDNNGDIYLTMRGVYSVSGADGDGADIVNCVPGSIGDNTTCTYSPFWDGSTNGFAGEVINGLFLSR